MDRLNLFLCFICTLIILVWTLNYSNYGIDFTDEGYYLSLISNPFFYQASATQFGFVYHPIYLLAEGNIAIIRKIDLLISFSLAWYLTYTFLNLVIPIEKKNILISQIISLGLATSIFLSYNIPTPNYNSLGLQAVMLIGIGLFNLNDKIFTKNIFGSFLIGLGGWLSFMAKPSSAFLVAIGVFIYLISARKHSTKIILISVVFVIFFFLLTAQVIDRSVLNFINRIQLGMEFREILGAGYSFIEIFRIDIPEININNLISTFIIFITLTLSLWFNFSQKNLQLALSSLILLIISSIVIFIVTDKFNLEVNLGSFHNIHIFGVTFAVLLLSLMFSKPFTLQELKKYDWKLMILLLFMPFFFAFGSNNNYWVLGGHAGIFWVLAGMFLINSNGATLKLSSDYASYIKDVRMVSAKSGFKKNDPVIDLTGQSPGILYLLGAENLGYAWLSGDYPGSLKQAKSYFNLISCQKISNAWIIYEINGPRSISNELMLYLGANFPEEYVLEGSWETAVGAGGYDITRIQELYKPQNPIKTLNKCQKLRYERTNNK